ncbi:MAG: ArsR/SmtB family transcription factor [Paraclostridium dentum]|uniref:Winged helix-turn-helix transcriptional regulator n=1 Tax=Paraclostridium bifermentans TaxID=1490 RepID=A0AA44DMS3_PARBF|nr:MULTISPECIES: metalloregulator ArsR/SmtB family transcription factor [Paraclostridium]MCU9809743.1 metalloregulator ArsR/SmtB family transcription factor [Paraclostridium sp. AKS46]MDV8113360.1 metalloregulator ArsR/SmtB family transcription factor [Bacillus sp. BAU-SS-2023]MBN8048976.1 winged helix-turn-helix transcriptional regulator [Paraclostridium bifermentans]MCU9812483.1 metalloregulator ArsR/SmtB family transcription factor [Paraclostridium sp. AKS81]NME10393.1 winged helix-turn-hel
MELIQILKALSDESRLRILNILRNGPLCVCEIEAILEISQSNASRHLSKLTNANLVNYYKEAKFIYYKLDHETLKQYSFIQNILDNELDKDKKLKYDYEILKAYKNANLSCDTVSQVKDVILEITK